METATRETATRETATCEGCETEVAVDLAQCPVCGFEPSAVPARATATALFVFLPILAVSLVSLLSLFLHVLNGMAPDAALRAALPIGFVGAAAGVFLYVLYAQLSRTSTDRVF